MSDDTNGRWTSLLFTESVRGYDVSEAARGFQRETLTENILRLVGILLTLGAYALWLLPVSYFKADPLITRIILSFTFVATGVFLYMFSMRGFRHEIQIAPAQRVVHLARLNGQGQSRITKTIEMADIGSFFVKRPTEKGTKAALWIRLKNEEEPSFIMRGELDELERLHERLLRDIRFALERTVTPKRPPKPRGLVRFRAPGPTNPAKLLDPE
ncbi:MAG: hypothetical protein HUJ27_03930 [Rhodobacteraceae bacterium]|nr:hypothetical protein [Paracoccaceae bacterium]